MLVVLDPEQADANPDLALLVWGNPAFGQLT